LGNFYQKTKRKLMRTKELVTQQLMLPFNAPVAKPRRRRSASAKRRASDNIAASVVVQELQRRRGWSHEQMAKTLGLSPRRLSHVVNRTTRDVEEVLEALGVRFPGLDVARIVDAAHCRAPLAERIARAEQAAQKQVA
jgi:lambda repressor-like predicted transcriptional regulator